MVYRKSKLGSLHMWIFAMKKKLLVPSRITELGLYWGNIARLQGAFAINHHYSTVL